MLINKNFKRYTLLFVIMFFLFNVLMLINIEQVNAEDIRNFQLKIPIGGKTSLGTMKTSVPCQGAAGATSGAYCVQIPWLVNYIQLVYNYSLVLGSILAVTMIVIGGFMYLMGGANPALISKAKQYIFGAVSGLVLILGAYTLLQLINPNLTVLKPIEVEVVRTIAEPADFCDDILSLPEQKALFDVKDYPSDGVTCNKKYDVAVKSGKERDVVIAEGTQCIGSRCATDQQACTKFATPEYKCVDALVYGSIIPFAPGPEGKVFSQAGVTDAGLAYISLIQMVERDTSFLGIDDIVGVTRFDPEVDKEHYLIVDSGNMNLAKDYYYLEIDINDPDFFEFGGDYDVDIDRNGNVIKLKGNKCCTLLKSSNGTDSSRAGCEMIKKSELQAGGGVKISFNVQDLFYIYKGDWYPLSKSEMCDGDFMYEPIR